MAGLNLSPHQVSVHPETNLPVITATDPYIRISGEGHPPLYLQRGKVYSDAGDVVPQESWPEWALPNIARLSLAAQAEVGFVDFVQNLNNTADLKDLHRPIPPVEGLQRPEGYPVVSRKPEPLRR